MTWTCPDGAHYTAAISAVLQQQPLLLLLLLLVVVCMVFAAAGATAEFQASVAWLTAPSRSQAQRSVTCLSSCSNICSRLCIQTHIDKVSVTESTHQVL
jgi:hypothetical protein